MSQERPIRLHAGPWSLEFERWTGWLRNICLGDDLVLRAVYVAARGEDWRTFRFHTITHHVCQEQNGFQASWTSECEELGFRWTMECRADSQSLNIVYQGRGTREFKTRRTGMCLLHPHEQQGQPIRILHPDGSHRDATFPSTIAPDHPFTEIVGFQLPLKSGIEVTAKLDGEIFETEDQRNWTDASFKTYCRPQNRPAPYEVQPQQVIQHAVSLGYRGDVVTSTPATTTHLSLKDTAWKIPMLGTQHDSEVDGFDFVLCQDPDSKVWHTIGGHPDTVFSLDRSSLDFIRGQFYYGLGENFVNVNTRQPDMEQFDGIGFGVNPQIHAFDDRSVMENIHAQSDVVKSALEISQTKPVFVGPIYLDDDRLSQPIGMAWFAASFATLASSGANALSFFEARHFNGPINELYQSLREFREEEITLMTSTDPYRAIGFRLHSAERQQDFFVNMTPYLEEIAFEGQRLTLDPYEVKIMSMSERTKQ